MAAHRQALLDALERFAERARTEQLSLEQVLTELKDASFAIIGIVLCLPFVFPVTILGPLTIPGGMAIAALGWQMWRGNPQLKLPRKLASVKLGETAWRALLHAFEKIVRICERFAKPRYAHWTAPPRGDKLAGLFVLLAGVLLAIPMGGVVPFNNTLPALCAICACVAILENDGLWFGLALFWLVLTVIYFVLIAVLLLYFGAELKVWLAQNLPAWMQD
jgi:hypothetical protein